MIEPRKPARGMDVLTWCLAVWEYLRARRIVAGPGITTKESPSGVIISADIRAFVAAKSPPCPFGSIIIFDDDGDLKTGIAGGLIKCGNQNWNMDPFEVDLDTDGDWLVSIEVQCEVRMDDDSEILLGGVVTGTKPTEWTKTVGDDYPENSDPEIPDGEATVHLPIGRLIVAGGSASLDPTGCGPFVVTHCDGTISYTRNP